MSHLEYCACGHPLDHIGKPCRRPLVGDGPAKQPDVLNTLESLCPCPSGIRVDVATFQILTDLTRMQAEQCQMLARILAVVENAAGLQSRLVDAGNGRAKVEVKAAPPTPRIVMP